MANLPIPDETTWIKYDSQTGTGPFSFTFSVFAKADLRVKVGDTELAQSGFTFTGTLIDTGYDGGSIELVTPAAAEDVLIWREVTPARASDFAPASSVSILSIDAALDRLTAHAQDARRDLDRAIKVSLDADTPADTNYDDMIADAADAVGAAAVALVTAEGVEQVAAVEAAGDVILTPTTGSLAVAEAAAIAAATAAVEDEGDAQVLRVAGTPGSTLYADDADGLAATTSGEYFLRVETGDKVATVVLDNAGVAVDQASYPSHSFVAGVADKVGETTYEATDVPVGGLPASGAGALTRARIHGAPSAAAASGGPLNSFDVRIAVGGAHDGTATLLLLSSQGGTNYRIEAAYPVTGLVEGVNSFAAGGSFIPSTARVETGWFAGYWSASGGSILNSIVSSGGGSNIAFNATSVAVGDTFSASASNSTLGLEFNYATASNAIDTRIAALDVSVDDLIASFDLAKRSVFVSPFSAAGGTPRGGFAAGLTTGVDIEAGTSYRHVRIPIVSPASDATYIRLRHYRRPAANSQSAAHLAGTDTQVGSALTLPIADIADDGTLTFTLPAAVVANTTNYDYFVWEAFNASDARVTVDTGSSTGATGTVLSRGSYFFNAASGGMTVAASGVAVAFEVLADVYVAPASASGGGASSADVVIDAEAEVAALDVTFSGFMLRETAESAFHGSVTLTASTTGSVVSEARTLGQATSSGAPGYAVCPVAGRLTYANVSNVVVTRVSDSAVLTVGTDYLLNAEHGSICLPSTGSNVAVTVSYDYALRKYATIYLDPETMAGAAVYGTERTRDAHEFLPVIPTKAVPLFNARIVGSTAELIPVWGATGGGMRSLREQAEADRLRNRKCLARARAKLLRGTLLKIGMYGDSGVAMQNGTPSATTPNGTTRDRAASSGGYLLDGAVGSDIYSALTLYTATANGWADDGAGAVHTRFGHVWSAVEEVATAWDATIGTDIIVNNWGIAGTDLNSTGNNGLNTTRLNAFLAGGDHVAVLHFGGNSMTTSTNEANLASLVDQCLAAGMEVIVCGVVRFNLYRYSLTYQNWLAINRICRRVAETKNVAFADTACFYAADFLGALGISSADCCSANLFNHPGPMEFERMARPIAEALLP